MQRLILLHLLLLLSLSSGLFGPGALASDRLADPMMPPPLAMQKFREARLARQPRPAAQAKPDKPRPRPMRLMSILYSSERQIAIIDDQMLAVGDRIRGAELIELTRVRARLRREGKIIDLSLGDDRLAIKKKPVEGDL